MDSSTTIAEPAVITGIAIAYLVLFIFFAIPSLIVTWQLYTKAGKPGWSAIIPIYNVFVMAQIGKVPTNWAIAYAVAVVLSFIPVLGLLFSLVGLGIAIYILVQFIKQYDRGIGFWASYILLPLVALFLVKDAKYTGGTPASAPAAAGAPGAAASPNSSAPEVPQSTDEPTKTPPPTPPVAN